MAADLGIFTSFCDVIGSGHLLDKHVDDPVVAVLGPLGGRCLEPVLEHTVCSLNYAQSIYTIQCTV